MENKASTHNMGGSNVNLGLGPAATVQNILGDKKKKEKIQSPGAV